MSTSPASSPTPPPKFIAPSWLRSVSSVSRFDQVRPPDDPEYWEQEAEVLLDFYHHIVLTRAVELENIAHLRLLCNCTCQRAETCLTSVVLSFLRQACGSALQMFNGTTPMHADEIRRLVYRLSNRLLRPGAARSTKTIRTLTRVAATFMLTACPLPDVAESERVQYCVRLTKEMFNSAFGGLSACSRVAFFLSANQVFSTFDLPEHLVSSGPAAEEVADFLRAFAEPAAETAARVCFEQEVIEAVHEVLQLQCHRYGSTLTGLRDRESDIDLGVDLNECLQHGELKRAVSGSAPAKTGRDDESDGEDSVCSRGAVTAAKLAVLCHKRLQESRAVRAKGWGLELRATAKKPMIRIFQKASERPEGEPFSADVSFSKGIAGLRNSALLRNYTLLDSRVHPLVVIVKYWSRQRGVNGSYFGFWSSFAHSLTVITYLQDCEPPVLPNLQMPQSVFAPDELPETLLNESFIIKDPSQEKLAEDPALQLADAPWANWKSRNKKTVGQLILGYFEYMAFNFPWSGYIMSPRVAPMRLRKTDIYVANNIINYAPALSPKKIKKKKQKKAKKLSTKSAEINTITTDGQNEQERQIVPAVEGVHQLSQVDITTRAAKTEDVGADRRCVLSTKGEEGSRPAEVGDSRLPNKLVDLEGAESVNVPSLNVGVSVEHFSAFGIDAIGIDGSPSKEEEEILYHHSCTRGWMYYHPDHTISDYIQKSEACDSVSFHKLSIEDPCETERILIPFRSTCQEQLMCEYLRAWLLLAAGKSLDIVCDDFVPRDRSATNPSPIDFDHMSHLEWFNGRKEKSATEILRDIREEIWLTFLQYLSGNQSVGGYGLLPDSFVESGGHFNVKDYWAEHREEVDFLGSALQSIEDKFAAEHLRIPSDFLSE